MTDAEHNPSRAAVKKKANKLVEILARNEVSRSKVYLDNIKYASDWRPSHKGHGKAWDTQCPLYLCFHW